MHDFRDLDRLSDDIFKDRRISGSVYCGKCGYNLRTLPYLYQCPECGNDYNARPLVMKGVFLPQQIPVPWIDMLAVGFFGYIAYTYVSESLPAKEYPSLVVGIVAAVLGLIYLALLIRKWRTLIAGRILLRRIAESREE